MNIAYIETAGLTNDDIRAASGAHPLCCGYPDGVPETWRDVAPVKQEGIEMPEKPGKHFIRETRGGAGGGLLNPAGYRVTWEGGSSPIVFRKQTAMSTAKALGGVVSPLPPLDPAALLGPVAEPLRVPRIDAHLRKIEAEIARARARNLAKLWRLRGARPEPGADPVGHLLWEREALRQILAEDDYPLGGIAPDDDDDPADWPEPAAAGDEEC